MTDNEPALLKMKDTNKEGSQTLAPDPKTVESTKIAEKQPPIKIHIKNAVSAAENKENVGVGEKEGGAEVISLSPNDTGDNSVSKVSFWLSPIL